MTTNADAQRLRELMAYEAARKGPPEGFPSLPPIAGGRYSDAQFYGLERDALFRKSWLLAAHMDEIPEPGCFLRWDIAGVPVVLAHGQDGTVNALINRCSHRGAPVALERCGKKRSLTCPYHGWSYGLGGELISVREPRDFNELDKQCLSLRRARCERLGKLIFVNFDMNAPTLEESLGPLVDEWKEFDLSNCRLSCRHQFRVRCNWKIAMEANMEVYHVPNIHRATIASRLDSQRNVNTLYAGGHGRMIAPIPGQSPQPEWTSSWPEIETAGEISRTCTQSYNVFPNLVMPLNQYVIPPIQFWPTGIDECIIETWTMAPDWGSSTASGPDMWTDDNGARPGLVLREDIEISEGIQAGIVAGFERPIQLGYQEARIYHWHQAADAVIGTSSIPSPLRVAPVLDEIWYYPNEPRLK